MANPERRIFSNNGVGYGVIGVFCHEFGHGMNHVYMTSTTVLKE